MSEHPATVIWRRTSPDFTYETYNRRHEWRFAGGVTVLASSAVEFKGDADRVNPEEAFVASLSSCHMLTFLAIAAKKRLGVEAYEDDAVGYLERNAKGKLCITRAVLRPRVRFMAGVAVSHDELEALHHASHANCFIANSVHTDIHVEPQF
jgi:organic hydroperoxide reductase OsmC/OhrA